MGLDIFIETKPESESKRESCHGISREFCYQICNLTFDNPNSELELIQIYQIYDLDFRILSRMNVWQIEEQLRYGDSNQFTKDEIEAFYNNAFQPSIEFLKNLKSLYSKIRTKPELLTKVKWRNGSRVNYTDQFDKNIGKYIVDRNLGWDLRTMINFLEKLSESTLVRFGFV
ncbi:MAG: hypothetical protein GY810_21465 [Aureispira sp.]|nr:hypothetical protein [Aureispira sp.]